MEGICSCFNSFWLNYSGKPLLGDLGIVTNDKYSKSVDFLKSYASERWDAILHFMVGSESAEVGSVVKDVLLLSNLMKWYVQLYNFGFIFKYFYTNRQ